MHGAVQCVLHQLHEAVPILCPEQRPSRTPGALTAELPCGLRRAACPRPQVGRLCFRWPRPPLTQQELAPQQTHSFVTQLPEAHLGNAGAVGVLRILFVQGVPQHLDAEQDDGGGSQALHNEQPDAVHLVPSPQAADGVPDAHVQVVQEGPQVEQECCPAVPAQGDPLSVPDSRAVNLHGSVAACCCQRRGAMAWAGTLCDAQWPAAAVHSL